ncbi:hypothetical protein [Corynebacterium pyruviciproducens]|uniref:Uncharacterized protein n=1 Tax=Corynebacterium pyruviciproducens TaxID=598660 RepID=A0AAF0YTW0_9CORY|nr:hypothetical protein [Corynebacterium pyruviciproducens]WOT03400.1 hypothetical protein CYJ47_06510 [Corynebacterium pyruviciproducens]
MKVQLINYMTYPEIEFFETCCTRGCEGIANYPTYEFESGGKTWKVDAWLWHWGSYYEICTNPIAFAEWLKEQDLDNGFVPRDYHSLEGLVDLFRETSD